MTTRTTCPYCGVGCGVTAEGARAALSLLGDEAHPANHGKLCSKGSALGETVQLAGRLLHPMIGERRATWPHVYQLIAQKFAEAIEDHGPDSVAFYVSGQLLTEDYYVANKLMKGFIGSSNIDTNSRLCMASAVAAQKLAFGEDVVPACYEDLDLADLIVFSGHNAAWTHPVLYRRMEAMAQARAQRHIVIDPRETDTARAAFLHLKLRSQTDVRLWNGLLAYLWETGSCDATYIAKHTIGFDAVLAALQYEDQSIAAVAADCGLNPAQVQSFYQAFARTPRTVTLYSQGANQSIDGVAKCLSIINAHLATGRVSQLGASPFSITGQPNAMGGRETGGMANTLAAHMDFAPEDVDRVRRFWRAPQIAAAPGLKAVDMFDAVADSRIKAIWIMATNPAVSMPNASAVRSALRDCPFVVVSDVIAETDTSRFAHVRLPALAWGEKDGTVTNSERCISRQRALLPAPGEARADWRIIADVASVMGFGEAFTYGQVADVFREYANLTRFENDGARVLNLGALSELDLDAYDHLAPTPWPIRAEGDARPFRDAVFSTPDGKARFSTAHSVKREPVAALPLLLNTGRVRDQWHTMTRTGLAPRLMRHAPEPLVEIHPRDAKAAGIIDGALCEIRTELGAAVLTARLTDTVRVGEIFAPMHWSDDFAPHARSNPLVSPEVDARSGQPEFKRTPARIAPVDVVWRAFLVSRDRCHLPASLWWRRIPQAAGDLYEIAASASAPTPNAIADLLLTNYASDALIKAADSAGQFLRVAAAPDNRLERAFFATRGRGLPARDWLVSQLEADTLDDETRRLLLSGGPYGASRGANVCACFDVGRSEIEMLAKAAPDLTVAHVATTLKAGSNCGSCRPEIVRIINEITERAHVAA